MYKKQKKITKVLIILMLFTVIFSIPFQMNPEFIRKDIGYNLRNSQEYESAGLIALWSGPLDTIPTGWKLCDGTDGTINTTSVFVYSTDSMEAPGATGGSTLHSHSYSMVPYHDHGVSSTTYTPHSHSYSTATTYRDKGQPWPSVPYYALGIAQQSTGTSDASHDHGGYTSYSGTSGLLYTSEEEDIIPPYYGMAFIEKEASDNTIPIGLIVMWAGGIDSIPTGWELCNGSNGTPDLRDKFIRGAAPGEDPGALGGTIAHNHTYTEIPQHRHVISDSIGGSHSHSNTYGVDAYVGALVLNSEVYRATSGYTDYASYPHTHSIPAVGLTNCTTEDTENLPPYFKVAFIMNTVEKDLLPLGAITMWGDSIASIPSGWNQCTGTSGTFKMLNRFPIGVANGEQPGLVGGSATHRHVYTEVPQHTHTIPSDPMTHRHSLRTKGSLQATAAGSTGCDCSGSMTVHTATSNPSHYHDILPTGSANCYTSYENSLPPYVKLIYMQKGKSLGSPTPLNGATDIEYDPQLSVYVSDLEGDNLNVTFYDASDDTLIDWDYVFGGSGTAIVTWAGLSNGTLYSWYVKIDDGSSVSQSAIWSFTTNYAPGVPTNPTPLDEDANINYSPTLSVDVFDNDGDPLTVTFYDASGDSLIGSDIVYGGSGTASVTWAGLSNGTSYSWYTKSDDELSVVQSATWSFTTNYVPGVPTNPTPSDEATRINYNPILSVDVFDNDGDPLTVTFYDASDDSLIGSDNVVGGIGNASVVWSGILPGSNYTWYTTANDGLNITQSATWSFVTNYEPDAPTNPTPNNGATDINDDPTLIVDAFDSDGDVLTVSFYDASDDSLIDSELVLGGNGTASVTWAGLSSDTTYSWYAKSDDGLSVIQSATWSFTTAIWALNHAPDAPVNPTPNHGATGVGENPTLSVHVSDVDGDSLTVTFYDASDDSLIGSDIVHGGSGTASVNWSGVTSNMVCHWYAIANDGMSATQSTTWTFSTTEPTNPPDYTAVIIGSSVGGAAIIGVLSIYFIRRKRKG